VCEFEKFRKGGIIVEEKDRHLGKPDEEKDVEAHSHINAPAKDAPALNETEDDDVEAHVHLNSPAKDSPAIN
jgi:hypothetical protein